ncbi:MAG: lipid II flippase MurJ, partial [Pseudomonadota bacterium]
MLETRSPCREENRAPDAARYFRFRHIYQFNQFIGTLLASFLPEGSVSWLYYADRLVQFPLGVFAIAVSTAALPS